MDNQTWIERNGFVPRETSRKRPRIDDFSNKIGFRVLVSNQTAGHLINSGAMPKGFELYGIDVEILSTYKTTPEKILQLSGPSRMPCVNLYGCLHYLLPFFWNFTNNPQGSVNIRFLLPTRFEIVGGFQSLVKTSGAKLKGFGVKCPKSDEKCTQVTGTIDQVMSAVQQTFPIDFKVKNPYNPENFDVKNNYGGFDIGLTVLTSQAEHKNINNEVDECRFTPYLIERNGGNKSKNNRSTNKGKNIRKRNNDKRKVKHDELKIDNKNDSLKNLILKEKIKILSKQLTDKDEQISKLKAERKLADIEKKIASENESKDKMKTINNKVSNQHKTENKFLKTHYDEKTKLLKARDILKILINELKMKTENVKKLKGEIEEKDKKFEEFRVKLDEIEKRISCVQQNISC